MDTMVIMSVDFHVEKSRSIDEFEASSAFIRINVDDKRLCCIKGMAPTRTPALVGVKKAPYHQSYTL